MHDLFNPAGLCMLEDQEGAIAYGYLEPRVFYTRWVGRISAGLGARYVRELERRLVEAPGVVCFADTSALEAFAGTSRASLADCFERYRARLASLIVLCGSGPAPRAFGEALADPGELLFDPLEFESALSNVTRRGGSTRVWELPEVWQVHAPS